MKKILIVLLGILAFQGSVWGDTKCNAGDPYAQECHAQGLSACWDMTAHPSYPAQSNPWVVGEAVLQNDKMKECRQVCAINDTCWQEKWVVAGNQPLGDLSCVVAGNQINSIRCSSRIGIRQTTGLGKRPVNRPYQVVGLV